MSEDTRNKILHAARDLFITKGADGVNMREIAEKAEVNKGLLHYYFKNKRNLFTEIFKTEAIRLYEDVEAILVLDVDLEEKISAIVDRYFSLLGENPQLPAFVLFEAAKEPEMLNDLPFVESVFRIAAKLEMDLESHGWKPLPGQGMQFLLDIISLCAFYFAMSPVFARILPEFNDSNMQRERREHIKTLLIKSVQK